MNIGNYSWRIGVDGSEFDLKHLDQYFGDETGRVTWDEHAGKFAFTSASLDTCSDSGEVLRIAEQQLLVLSGVLKITRGSRQPLRPGNVYKLNADGTRDYFMNAQAGAYAVDFCDATLSVTGADGSTISQPPQPPRSVRLAQIASTDHAVAKVSRLIAMNDAQTWVGMYRIHEVIEHDLGGEHSMRKRGWGSGTDHKRFKHSANSVSVGGDESRHGEELGASPKNPMAPEEAVAYLNYVVEAWLASKGV